MTERYMALRLYNTMTRRVDDFVPISGNRVGLYTCGPTVYNYAHIGNLRTYVFEDVLKRALKMSAYQVRHVMNVTDVGHLTSDSDVGEDKMEKGALREGKTVWEIADFYFQAFRKDMAALHLIEPDVWCKATDHIAEQIALIQTLENKGFTYTIEDGVYFDTSRLSDYGKLARLDVAGLQAGARVDMVAGKRNATDFALWKFSPKDKKRLMEWPSPWGVGFPGWPIERSATAMKYLGEQADIHCGGVDHVAVHHSNEIAQSESATGKKWINWWMHAEFLVIAKDGEAAAKMAKSAGGFLRLQSLVEKGFDPLAYRYFCLNAHYRAQLAFSWEALESASNAFERLRAKVLDLRQSRHDTAEPLAGPMDEFRQAVEDDLNMPRALAAMWSLLRESQAPKAQVYATLRQMDSVLGFGVDTLPAREANVSDDLAARIEQMIQQRAEAKKARDFARADAIRKQLADEGITLEDTPKGTTWRRS